MVKFISDFEQVMADIAIGNRYYYVVCGHLHFPEIKKTSNDEGEVTYLISGDWVENLSSLEYQNGKWRIYHLLEDLPALRACNMEKEAKTVALSNNGVLKNLIKEFNVVKTKETR